MKPTKDQKRLELQQLIRETVGETLITKDDLEALHDRMDRVAINAQKAIDAFRRSR